MNTFRPKSDANIVNLNYNGDRARWLLIGFNFLLVLTVLSFISNLLEFNLLGEEDFDYNKAAANDTRQMIVGVIQVVSQITITVLFIMWFRRAYNNLHLIGRHMEFGEGWAAGAWFVPFLNLVRPYQIMREIWIDTQDCANIEPRQATDLVGWWWAVFLISNFIANIASRVYVRAESIEAFRTGSGLYLFSDVIAFLSILVVIRMVKQASEFEEVLYRNEYETPIEDHLI